MSVYVRAELAAAMPGGLPATFRCDRHIWWTPGSAGMGHTKDGGGPDRIPLPGPDALNAAGLLRRLAESLGAELEPWEVPVPEITGRRPWYLAMDSILPSAAPIVLPHAEEPDEMTALAWTVEECSLLHAVARLAGLEPVPGEWPMWGREDGPDGNCWTIRVGGDAAFSMKWAPDEDDPRASLEAVWELA